MRIKKIFVCFFILKTIIIFSNDRNIAKYYIDNAYKFFQQGLYNTANEMLDKAFNFDVELPEYYYLKNLIIGDKRESIFQRVKNADKILLFIKNCFLFSEYQLYKHASEIYHKVYSFEKAYNCYIKLINSEFRDTEDFINLIKLLFVSSIKTHFENIPFVITEAKKYFSSLDFEFFLTKYKILKKEINRGELNLVINRLMANNYNPYKIIYLELIFYNEKNKLYELVKRYQQLLGLLKCDSLLNIEILYNFLLKSEFLTNEQIVFLIKEWSKNAISDYRTDGIIKIKKVLAIIKNNKIFEKDFFNYTGVRYKDDDFDGIWEELYEYKNGIIIKRIVDKNQDYIFEWIYNYTDSGVLREVTQIFNENSYRIFGFNTNDKTVEKVEDYFENRIMKRFVFIPSILSMNEFERVVNPNIFLDKDFLKNITFVEEFDKNFYKKTKYENGNRVYTLIDKNFNGIYEEKIIYKNDTIYKKLIDFNENNIYETQMDFLSDKLVKIEQMLDEKKGIYNYIEIYNNDSITKKWDNDFDSIFEVEITEFNDGRIVRKMDINFDNLFDIAFEYKDNNLLKVIELKSNKVLFSFTKNVKDVYKKETTRIKYNIITLKKNVLSPDMIEITDTKKLNGFFVFRGDKFYFNNGIIETPAFRYKLFLIDDQIYLYDETQ